MAMIKRIGYGQVEPNHMSAQRTGQIYAQLPAEKSIEQLENGQFVKYDYLNKEVNFTGKGEWMMVFNELKNYNLSDGYKDFALLKSNASAGEMIPRLFKTNIGDIFTTNMVGEAAKGANAEYAGVEIAKDDVLVPNDTTGILEVAVGDPAEGPVFQVVDDKVTMPDGQPAVKVMRIE